MTGRAAVPPSRRQSVSGIIAEFRERFACAVRRFHRRDGDAAASRSEAIYALLVDPLADGMPEAENGSPSRIVTLESIRSGCWRMRQERTKGGLLTVLADEVARYDLRDLEQMQARFERKVSNLPEGYRDRLLLHVREQIFGAHHRLLLLSRSTMVDGMDEALDPGYPAYCAMVADACAEKAQEGDPKFLYLKYLLAAFTLFVLEEPAHPVGTPFPGGQIVDEWEGTYLCPVRELADDVPHALCMYCPAVQSAEPTYPEMRVIQRERRRRESLSNYWTNYKG